MARCKGEFSGSELCDKRVRRIADKGSESKRVRIADDCWASHPYTWMYPTKPCPSGLCDYHYNLARWAKLGVGRRS